MELLLALLLLLFNRYTIAATAVALVFVGIPTAGGKWLRENSLAVLHLALEWGLAIAIAGTIAACSFLALEFASDSAFCRGVAASLAIVWDEVALLTMVIAGYVVMCPRDSMENAQEEFSRLADQTKMSSTEILKQNIRYSRTIAKAGGVLILLAAGVVAFAPWAPVLKWVTLGMLGLVSVVVMPRGDWDYFACLPALRTRRFRRILRLQWIVPAILFVWLELQSASTLVPMLALGIVVLEFVGALAVAIAHQRAAILRWHEILLSIIVASGIPLGAHMASKLSGVTTTDDLKSWLVITLVLSVISIEVGRSITHERVRRILASLADQVKANIAAPANDLDISGYLVEVLTRVVDEPGIRADRLRHFALNGLPLYVLKQNSVVTVYDVAGSDRCYPTKKGRRLLEKAEEAPVEGAT